MNNAPFYMNTTTQGSKAPLKIVRLFLSLSLNQVKSRVKTYAYMVITEWTEGKPSDKIKNLQISEDFEVVTPYPRPGPAPLPTMDLKWVIAVKKQPPPLEPLVRPPIPNVDPPMPLSPVRPPTADIPPTSMSNPLTPIPIPSTSASTSAPPASATSPGHPPSSLFEPYVPPAAHPTHALYTEHKASVPVRPSVSDSITVKKMDPYEEGLDFVFWFGFEKLKLIFGLVSGSGSCALAF